MKVTFKIDIVNNIEMNYQAIKRKTFKIGIYGCKEILGLECLVYNIPLAYDAIVVSEKAILYKIDSKKILSMLNTEKNCIQSLNEYTKNKMKSLIDRLNELKNINIECYNLKNRNGKLNEMNFRDIYKKLHNGNVGEEDAFSPPSCINSVKNIDPIVYKKLNLSPKNGSVLISKFHQPNINSSIRLINSPNNNLNKKERILQEKSLRNVSVNNSISIKYSNDNKLIDLKMDLLKKKFVNAVSLHKLKTSNNSFSKFDDEKILNLPKISLINYSELNTNFDSDKKKSLIDILKSFEKVHKEDIENEEINLFQKALNLKSAKINKISLFKHSSLQSDDNDIRNNKKDYINIITDQSQSIHKSDRSLHKFRNLFILKRRNNVDKQKLKNL